MYLCQCMREKRVNLGGFGKKIRCCGEEERFKKLERRLTYKPRALNPSFCGSFFPPTYIFPFCLANMACGATLKRSMEFEALLSPQSPKRRRCNPLPGTPGTPSPQRCNLRPPVDSPTHSMSPPAIGGEHRLTPEQIFQNLRQEYSRIQRRRQLEGAFNQTEACSSSDAPSPSSALNAPSSPPGASRKDQPSFTLKQVSYLCERLLKDHEEKIREEYEQILNTKLAEQYESFVKFTQDQIMRRYGARPASYVS